MSKDYAENLFTLDIKRVLGVNFNAPNHLKLLANLSNKTARQKIDKEYLLLQHNTTGYKLGASSYYLSQLKSYSHFYSILNLKEDEWEIEMDFTSQAYFQLSIDNFFATTMGSVTSICRELWKVYDLKIKPSQVNFYFTKEKFNIDFSNSDIAKYLDKINKETWFKYLNGARNRVEHGQLIMIEIKKKTGVMVIADEQNLEKDLLTTKMHYEPVPWCSTIFEETCKFVDYCCQDINMLLFE